MPRLSADVDVTLALEPDAPDRFAADMTAAGFSLRVDDPDFVRRTRVMPFVHVSTGMPVDVVLAGSGLEDEFLARARQTDVNGTMIPVIDLADLIIAKVLAGRPKDIDGIRALWRRPLRTRKRLRGRRRERPQPQAGHAVTRGDEDDLPPVRRERKHPGLAGGGRDDIDARLGWWRFAQMTC